jgi:hypothetical protein
MHLFMSSFEVLHPHCLGPILFASCELQTQTLENLLVHRLCCSSNTKTQLAKWPGVHFPYRHDMNIKCLNSYTDFAFNNLMILGRIIIKKSICFYLCRRPV